MINPLAKEDASHPDFQPDTLWSKFKAGDEQAFAAIYQNYVRKVFNYGKIYTSDEALIEDCIQDLFIDLWRRRQFLGDVVSVQFYLFKSIKRKIRAEQVKKNKIDQEILTASELHDVELSKEDSLIEDEKELIFNKTLENQLGLLSDAQREAIYLKYYRDMSPKEISVVMTETIANVYKLISRGITTLKKNMNNITILFWPLLIQLFLLLE